MHIQLYIIALLSLVSFSSLESVIININDAYVDLLHSSMCGFSSIRPYHEPPAATPTAGRVCRRICDPIITVPGDSSTIKYNPESALQIEASTRSLQDYKVGELFFDCYVRDEQERVQSILPRDEYKNPYGLLRFSANPSYEASVVSVVHPNVEFGGTFFRLDQSLALKCPDHISCAVRQISITPSMFQYTDERDGKERGPHNARTFWIKGSVDFAKSVFDLRVEGGQVRINMADLLLQKALTPVPTVPSAPPLDLAYVKT